MPSYISDRYKVGRMLGDGNFAVVRECVEHSTGREYALKIINKGKCRGKVNYKGKRVPHTYLEIKGYLSLKLLKYTNKG